MQLLDQGWETKCWGGSPYFRLINVRWFLWDSLTIGYSMLDDSLPWNTRFFRICQNPISCFLIDMKFTSKLLLILLTENYSFSILISIKTFLKYLLNFYIQNISSKNSGEFTFRKFSKMLILIYAKIICSPRCSHILSNIVWSILV